MTLEEIKKVHFIGIGGIGMSAVARLMRIYGKEVSGSDRERSPITDNLERQGIKIFIGHQPWNIPLDADLIIYTTAVDEKENLEFKKAKESKINLLTYPQFLGFFSRHKFTISISGTHGKTTTTSIVGLILKRAGIDPTVVVGGNVKEFKGNILVGKSRYFVVEACEYKEAFLNLSPRIIILTNIEPDHLDYYKNLRNIKKAFKKYINNLSSHGLVIANKDDKNIREVLTGMKCQKVWYGIKKKADYQLNRVKIKNGRAFFAVLKKNKSYGIFQTKLLGRHYLYDCLAAIALADQMKIKKQTLKSVLKSFSGTGRRFERRKTVKKYIVIDDYAHHPTEIKATMETAKLKYPDKRIVAVFQPHLYSRTKFLFNQFSQVFALADEVIITKIYAAREKREKGVSAKKLADKIKEHQVKVKYIPNFKEIEKYLKGSLKSGEVVIFIGAGDIYKLKL